MATQALASMVTPHPCNKSQEDRNWAALNNLLQILDQIIVINIDETTNEVTYNIQNITNLTVTNIDVTNIDVTNNLTVYNISVTNNATFVSIDVTTIDVTTINVVTINATYITTYNVTYNTLISVYGGGSGVYVCPTICTGSDTGTGGGGDEDFNDCCDEIGVPHTLTATISNKTGDCSCMPSSLTMTFGGASWASNTFSDCGGSSSIGLACSTGLWTITTPGAASFTVVSATCFPLELVIDVDSPGGLDCDGTYRLTITA